MRLPGPSVAMRMFHELVISSSSSSGESASSGGSGIVHLRVAGHRRTAVAAVSGIERLQLQDAATSDLAVLQRCGRLVDLVELVARRDERVQVELPFLEPPNEHG